MIISLQKLAQKVQTSLAKANIVAEETISSMKTVRSFANEAGERKTYRSKLDVTYRLRRKEAVAYGGFMILESVSISHECGQHEISFH